MSCHYYDRHDGKGGGGKVAQAGQCRRAAPLLNPGNNKSYMIEGVWPTVRDDDWCGEWKGLVRRVDPAKLGEVREAPAPSALPPRNSIREFGPLPRSGPVNLLTPSPGIGTSASTIGGSTFAIGRNGSD